MERHVRPVPQREGQGVRMQGDVRRDMGPYPEGRDHGAVVWRHARQVGAVLHGARLQGDGQRMLRLEEAGHGGDMEEVDQFGTRLEGVHVHHVAQGFRPARRVRGADRLQVTATK